MALAFSFFALCLLSSGSASGAETATCPRCEHRFVTSVHGEGHKGKARTQCRLCLLVTANYRFRLYQRSDNEEARREILQEWEAIRDTLRAASYDIGEFGNRGRQRLLRLENAAALSLALFDEAQRCERRASWSKQMAAALKKGKPRWSYAVRSNRRAVALFNDLIAAWKERAALFEAAAKLYRAQARDVTTDTLAGSLPAPTSPDQPVGGKKTAVPDYVERLVTYLEQNREALRELMVHEHACMERALARARGATRPAKPETADAKHLRALREEAFSTAVVTNLTPKRVVALDILRSNLSVDGSLDGFVERAPVLAEALRRCAKPPESKAAPGDK
ncbi:MAG: hypothetical protein ACYTG3_14935 [Planctomycetota bacterium]